MKFRALLVMIAFALVGAGCGGGETKKDEPQTEETVGSESEDTTEEAPAETAPMEDDSAAEEAPEGDEAAPEAAADPEGGE